MLSRIAVSIVACCAALGGVGALNTLVYAARSNDDIKHALHIRAPYEASVDTLAATVEANEPTPDCVDEISQTVWYRIEVKRPSRYLLVAAPSTYVQPVIAMYSAQKKHPGFSDLTQHSCAPDDGSGPPVFDTSIQPGTYYVQVGQIGPPGVAPHVHTLQVVDRTCSGSGNPDC